MLDPIASSSSAEKKMRINFILGSPLGQWSSFLHLYAANHVNRDRGRITADPSHNT
jgi:hypothetical protein